MPRLGSWIEPFPEGIYVRPADAWVDPSQPKQRALVTHPLQPRLVAESLLLGYREIFA